jgi:hypothetical protein
MISEIVPKLDVTLWRKYFHTTWKHTKKISQGLHETNLECKLDRLITIPQPQTLTCLPQPREPQDQSLAKNHSQTGEAQSQKLHLQPGLQYSKNQNSE